MNICNIWAWLEYLRNIHKNKHMSSTLLLQKPYDMRHTKEKMKSLDTDIRVLMGGSQAWISLPHVDPSWQQHQLEMTNFNLEPTFTMDFSKFRTSDINLWCEDKRFLTAITWFFMQSWETDNDSWRPTSFCCNVFTVSETKHTYCNKQNLWAQSLHSYIWQSTSLPRREYFNV